MDTRATIQSEFERLLTEDELAEQMNVEPTLLERLRAAGNGPPYVRLAPRTIRYRPTDAARWLTSRLCRGHVEELCPPK